ncbi:hypothetical protein [Desulfatitalea tepidiphila]|uniref:hypothetical protein n=1 Tax=Desulfatitalea tepidiphila TaxID=1185843 RepID=UPI0006B68B2B|nr:hypothetical protein [Desulfatitalea tepidiphila]
MAKKRPIDCHKCRHYYVTWQESTPHGCRAMGFKSAQLPSVVVYRSSGAGCLYYELRAVDGHEQERRLTHSNNSE